MLDGLLFRWEDLPESQRFISRSRDQRLPVGAHCQIKDTVRMAREDSQLLHLRLLPDYYFILGVSMRTHKFIHILRVNQVTDLAARIHPVHRLARQRVPESDTPISRATSATHRTMLMRRPCNSLHRGDVLAEFNQWLDVVRLVPDQQLVIVASRGQLLLVRAPLEAADFLLVAFELRKVVRFCSHVTVENGLVSGTAAQEGRCPGNAANASIMSSKLPDQLLFADVPTLQFTAARAHGQVVTVGRPVNARHLVGLAKVIQLRYLARRSRPEVHAGAKAYS
mmetsp:Transcript_28191/g.42678  ORF Transcript_28191/g.42678 Transcript_28191/m.42678 type:complete len:281 (+) Transcript_28191:125-967(+)